MGQVKNEIERPVNNGQPNITVMFRNVFFFTRDLVMIGEQSACMSPAQI